MHLTPIGVIHTPLSSKEDAPIQGAFRPEAVGTVELVAEYAEGLADVDGFSHLILLYAFDRAASVEMVRDTFLADTPHGLFATRHPARPNPIGLTVVRLVSVDGAVLTVAGVDMLDGTPLLDVKPYIARFDAFPDADEGWIAGLQERPKPPGRE
ncbi:MAG: tRNA (N6-threonylcarbamoyladenosine(37)-N6)-methyltransferase TrmO [Actinomycetota bacterium]|nr:tRNA (N6-threonylcarbamoyladenosine(37)-N6)-methyltransferase TrmO [Actinomycetota bacterium]